jgi:hypothetical protein
MLPGGHLATEVKAYLSLSSQLWCQGSCQWAFLTFQLLSVPNPIDVIFQVWAFWLPTKLFLTLPAVWSAKTPATLLWPMAFRMIHKGSCSWSHSTVSQTQKESRKKPQIPEYLHVKSPYPSRLCPRHHCCLSWELFYFCPIGNTEDSNLCTLLLTSGVTFPNLVHVHSSELHNPAHQPF